MLRVALVAGPDPGHALPVLGIGAELRRRGHDVTVWTGRRHERLAAQHGIEARELPHLAPVPGDDDLGVRLHVRAGGMARALTPQVRAVRPDLVVVDTLTRAGALTAAQLDRPHVEVVPHHLPDPDPDLPPVGLGRRLARTPWRRLDDRLLVRRQLRSVAEGTALADDVARSLGLPAAPTPALRLLQTLPSLERRRRRWPVDTVMVGPLALDPDLPPLTPPAGDDPLVLVTDTTATADLPSLGALALRGLDRLDLRLVVTSAALPPRRDGRTVVGTGPHLPLLARAALVVSPGGGGIVTKAAAAGVPHVVVPLAGDQREAAARVRDAGAGVAVRARRLRPATLRWAVVRALADDRLAVGAGRLAREAAVLGPALAADRCLEVVAAEGPRSVDRAGDRRTGGAR